MIDLGDHYSQTYESEAPGVGDMYSQSHGDVSESKWFEAPDRERKDYTLKDAALTAVSNLPKDTIENLMGAGSLLSLGARSMIPGLRPDKEEYVNVLKNLSQLPSHYYKNYGIQSLFQGNPKQAYSDIKQSIAERPIGTMLDVLPVREVLPQGKAASVAKALDVRRLISGPAEMATDVLYNNPAGSVYLDVAEGKIGDLMKAGYRNMESDLPKGYKPTLGQKAADLGLTKLSALEESVLSRQKPSVYFERKSANNRAIKQELKTFATGEEGLKQAIENRKAASQPLYDRVSQTIVPVDETFKTILQNPDIREAYRMAQEFAKNKKILKETGPSSRELQVQDLLNKNPNKVLGQNGLLSGGDLQLMKVVLDDNIQKLSNPINPEGVAKLQNAMTSKETLINYIENRIPEYAQARQVHAEYSKPIDQIKIGNALVKALDSNKGADIGIKRLSLLNTLADEPKALKSKAGVPYYKSFEDVLTPEQIDSVRKVKNALENEELVKSLAASGQSAVNADLQMTSPLPKSPGFINRGVTLANAAIDRINKKISNKIGAQLAEEMLNPEAANATILNTIERKQKASAQKAKTKKAINALLYFGAKRD